MSNSNLISAKITAAINRNDAIRLNPALYENLIWRPCNVRILMVADDFLYFSDEDFGLSDLIDALKTETLSYVRFTITVAHRGNPTDVRVGIGNPHISNSIKNFRFDDADDFQPDLYDQVWLFGSHRSRLSGGIWSNRLTDTELRTLMEFMNAGGGVFATGDHEDLGAAMGGFLPRVRQMRRWFFPNPGPNGEGLAPPFEGSGRFDTNREGHDSGYQFNDQSDDIPQPIEPKLYTANDIVVFRKIVFPHPVLCGPNGPIKVLPDHPHESQCTTAADPNASGTLAGLAYTEFPNATDGGPRPLPEVIATSRVIGGHTTSGKSGTTVARSFGAIGAYDGHRANVGRIVTDATWHHFININLTGDAGTPGAKGIGFLATTQGQAVYQEIRSYFVNIALWISPKARLACMRNWTLLDVISSHRLKEVFDPTVTLKDARLIDYILIGRHALDAIGKFAGRCQSYRWTWDFVLEEFRIPIPIDMGDPWRPIDKPVNELRELQPEDMLELGWVGEAALGGAILALREKMFPLNQKALDAFGESGSKIVTEGANQAVQRSISFIGKSLKASAERWADVGKR